MHKQIFVNLPVADLPRTQAFFGQLGFTFNAQFTNEKAACMVIGENIYAMLLTTDFFRGFASKPISDARQSTEVLVALTCDSREAVDDMVRKALAAGGTAPRPPQDHGFMYSHGFDDPDGHAWEVFYMDPATVEQG
ncbi:MAG: extradiol dioxygenase [Bordetella sp. SCN 67-23]|uniref:VOC family protein n=1 Tax=unclassified Pigmentiphaga TaxID=2626614 RepID=UPI00086CD5B4|nr:VOC family protein [Pigmentiphaga sp. H8]MBN9473177.1 VOC family protein [Burkholderiales bacterium]ODS69120.1 MAG: extradiol dioxygenase [Bordetella sp. SCN 67-23]ODU66926.1 MAG: extradiol dioxygenase [Bordetella sp. SCN 68-11]OJW89307.1 MAG: extradiol dioxygenase [Burkholderiales bacterium 67-32]AZG07160.1 glyoxalase/bleomycin resistance/extradiol dioxygenase family protein [Pigmentiphaga sp. H8]